MRGSSFGYLVKEGARNIYANRLMSLASIGVLVACLLLVGASVLFSLNVNGLVGYAEAQNEVVAFLYDDLDEDYIARVERDLNELDNVEDVRFISKNEGLEEWIAGMGDTDPALWAGLYDDNVLPDSYRMRIADLSRLDETTDAIEHVDGVESVRAPVEVAQAVTAIKQGVTAAGIAIVALLVAVASVIIANTIKITVFNRRKEISIMKFVGATDTFIRLPFVVEGLLLGVISATAAFGLLWGGYEALLHWLAQNQVSWFALLVENLIVFKTIALPLLGGFLLVGVGIGTLGSMFFVRKYLKV